MALHFVGFRDGSQLYRAMKLFGIPDFIHVKADARLFSGGELDPSIDVVVFAEGSKAFSIDEAIALCDTHTVDDSDASATEKWHMRLLTGQIPW